MSQEVMLGLRHIHGACSIHIAVRDDFCRVVWLVKVLKQLKINQLGRLATPMLKIAATMGVHHI